MSEWWQELSQVNRGFYCAAAFCSVFFAWQMISALIGLGDSDVDFDTDVDADGIGDEDHTYDEFEHGAETDATETVAAFKMLSVRSIIAFFTLFTWGGALYLNNGSEMGHAMTLSTIWGLAGMGSVAGILYVLRKMTHTGTQRIASCVGSRGTLYLDIPENGSGEVRVLVSGVLSNVKAKTSDGSALKAGTPVKVMRLLDDLTVEVTSVSG